MRLDELAKAINAQLTGGDGSTDVRSVAPLDTAQRGQVSFLSNPKYAGQVETTGASAVIVSSKISTDRVALLKTRDPYYAFMQAVVLLHGHRVHPHDGVHPKAHVDPTARIGEGTVIYPGVFVGPRATIGRDCILYPNAVIYDDTLIGERVIIHANSTIGVDGFGFATHDGQHHKIPQVGRVVIEDDVEIGAGCSISRGALDETRIRRGTKIDSHVVIGHGTTVGEHGLLVAQTGIAGSTTLGHHVTTGGQAGIAGHLNVGNQVTIAAQTGVMGDIQDKQIVIGSPAMPATHARRVYMIFTKLPEIVDRIRIVEQRLDSLESDGAEPIV
jgi:UDP-3-O-[3-hydroxymyristoyl] glucosamine N-acyltransferase